jgi:hypothetical protein
MYPGKKEIETRKQYLLNILEGLQTIEGNQEELRHKIKMFNQELLIIQEIEELTRLVRENDSFKEEWSAEQ